MESSPHGTPLACANCGNAIVERYCGQCGQARFVEADRRFGHLVQLALLDVFSWDGRWPRSIWALLARPGRLAQAWLNGRRLYYLSPIALFLLVNVVYFLHPPLSDFNLSFREQVRGQMHAPVTMAILDEHLRDSGLDRDAFAPIYESRSGEIGKLLLIVHAPFIALALMLVLAGSGRYYAEHMVVALHLLAWTLVLPMLIAPLLYLIAMIPAIDSDRFVGGGQGPIGLGLRVLLIGSLSLYYAVTVRRAYDAAWWRVMIAVPLCLFALSVAHMIYRGLQFVVVIWLS